MTASTFDQSRHDAQTVELFYFQYGDGPGENFSYNNSTEVISVDGVDYIPLPISYDKNIQQAGTLDKTQLSIKIPMMSDLAMLYAAFPPSQIVTVTIRQGDYADPDSDFPIGWLGRIVQSTRGDENNPSEAVLLCEPASTSMKRVGLRRPFQLSCPHVLYYGRCGASKAAGTITTTVDSVSGSTVTLPANWWGPFDPSRFVSGTFEYVGSHGQEVLTILGKSADDLTLRLSRPLGGLAPSDSVDVVLGCRRTMEDCKDLHNVIQDFGGQPWIPTSNPTKTNTFTQ